MRGISCQDVWPWHAALTVSKGICHGCGTQEGRIYPPPFAGRGIRCYLTVELMKTSLCSLAVTLRPEWMNLETNSVLLLTTAHQLRTRVTYESKLTIIVGKGVKTKSDVWKAWTSLGSQHTSTGCESVRVKGRSPVSGKVQVALKKGSFKIWKNWIGEQYTDDRRIQIHMYFFPWSKVIVCAVDKI